MRKVKGVLGLDSTGVADMILMRRNIVKQDKKMVGVIAGGVVALLAAGAGAWYYMNRGAGEVVTPIETPPEVATPAPEPIPPPAPVPEPVTRPPATPPPSQVGVKPPSSTPAPKPAMPTAPAPQAPGPVTTAPKPPTPAPKPPGPKPPNPAEVIQSGIAALNTKDYATAVTLFQKAQQLQPGNADIGYLLGMSLEGTGDLAAAQTAFESCTTGPYAQIARNHIKTIAQKLKKRR
jgi:hypothetical protein